MNCATTQQQQQSKPKQKTSSTTTVTTEITSSPATATSSLAANFNPLQNCSNNLERENLTLMRESVPEEPCAVENNTIQEIFENNNTSLSPLLILKPQNTATNEESTTTVPTTTTTTSISTIEAVDDISTAINNFNTNAVAPLEQEKDKLKEKEKEQEQKPNTTNNSLNEHSNELSACSSSSGSAAVLHQTAEREIIKPNRTPSPSISPHFNSLLNVKGVIQKIPSDVKLTRDLLSSLGANSSKADEDSISKSSDTSGELIRGTLSQDNSVEKSKSSSRLSERAKKKSWYNVLYPNYKSRSQDFKKLFREVPSDERLIVDYSCALQRDILVQGRLYVSQNYVCFHANIFRWETYLSIKWKDVTAITKEKTALVIPNAISICTAKEKYFFATFATRDKSFLMLFRVWQNTLMNKQMLPQEMWQWVHNCYGDELGLTTDDEDYIDPTSVTNAEAEVEESDSEFVSAVDDTSLHSKLEFEIEEEGDAGVHDNTTVLPNFDSVESYKQFTINLNSSSGVVSLINSTTCSSNIKINTKKSIKIKNSSTSSSTTTTSGSDNKTSDNNSSADSKSQRLSSSTKNKMKSNAKELTLISASPPEENVAVTPPATPPTVAQTMAVNGGNSSGSGSNAPAKENKSSAANTQTSAATYEGKRKVAKNNRQRDESSNKNSEPLPTDMSDSSDSDENKMPFVATAECNSTHEGRQLMHTILPINIETLFNLLFSKSKFLVDFHAMRKSTDTCFGDWSTNEEGQQTRIVNLTVQIAASVGPKTSKVTEYQVIRDCSKPGELYSVDINSVNAGIPYADSFSVLIHYCLVRTVDDHTMLSVHAQIKYKKSIWGVVKGFIEKNTWAGLEDFYTSLLHSLQSETNIPPAKGKGRRPRRGKHKQSANAANALSNTTTPASTASMTGTCNTATIGNDSHCQCNLHNHHHHHHHHNNQHNHRHLVMQICSSSSIYQHHHHQLQYKPNHSLSPQKHQVVEKFKGTAAQVRPLEEILPAIQAKPDAATEKVLAPHSLTPKHQTANKVIPGGNTKNYKWLSLFVVVLCLLLILLNVILLLKIWKMEGRIEEEYRSRTRMPNLSAMKQLPNTPQDWMELVRHQEILHETELKKWHKVLQTAIELLKKTEKTLAELLFR